MKISYQWLKEFVDLEVPPQKLAADLTNIGVAVETFEPLGTDFIFELDLTSNRPDCLSHFGVARELAAFYQKPLKRMETPLESALSTANDRVTVEIESPALCARYSARVLRGIRVAPSPEWLVRRLEAVGLRPINNVADVTNYVLMELGHPLHAFDLSKIAGRKILVREGRDGERLVTIDGVDRELTKGMLVIADQDRPVALAGIMGGLESEIGFSTQDVLLEAAWFNPISIRKTSKSLGMHTEASHRFERGANVNTTLPALDRAASLIHHLAGGEIQQAAVDCYPQIVQRGALFLRKARIVQVMGSEIGDSTVERILDALDFKIIERLAEGWRVDLPNSRLDVENEIDLIEEVARHYGYDKFPSTLPPWRGGAQRRPEYFPEKALRETLIHLGYFETLTYSFVDEAENRKFGSRGPIRLLNPLSTDTAVMRTSLLPGLLRSLLRNYHRGIKSLRLYEMGKIYGQNAGQGPKEELYLGMIASGNYQEKSAHNESRPLNFFDLKGDLEILLESVGILLKQVHFTPEVARSEDGQTQRSKLTYYHPAVSAQMWFRDQKFGVFGQLHPKMGEEYKIKQPIWIAEIPLQLWYHLRTPEKSFTEIPRFPSIQRDLSIVVDRHIDYARIESTVLLANIEAIQSVFPFDLYLGEKLPPGKKGISISIVYQALDRTLIEEEVNSFQQRILKLLEEKLGAQLRT